MPADRGFVFIRSASATPLVVRGLNPQDRSSSSNLTCTNVWHLTSPPLHTRKVAGSIPAGTTRVHAGRIWYLAIRNKASVIPVLSDQSRRFWCFRFTTPTKQKNRND